MGVSADRGLLWPRCSGLLSDVRFADASFAAVAPGGLVLAGGVEDKAFLAMAGRIPAAGFSLSAVAWTATVSFC